MARNLLARELSILGGPILAVIAYNLLPEAPAGVPRPELAQMTLAMTVWMGWWWLTEAIPVAATALLPLSLFPVFGIGELKAIAQAYAHPLIFLFLGGFVIAIAIAKTGLHRFVAYQILRLPTRDVRDVVGLMMLVTAAASMWVSNTAATIMMLPIALSLCNACDELMGAEAARFTSCAMLCVAYGATIGGLGTLIGSPPNLFIASYLEDHLEIQISFAKWMVLSAPLIAMLLPIAWYLLTRPLFQIPAKVVEARAVFGNDAPHWRDLPAGASTTVVVFVATALCWVLRPNLQSLEVMGARPFAHLTDAGISITAALALFVFPISAKAPNKVLCWDDLSSLPWGTLLLFGGGLALAATISNNGADDYLGLWGAGLAGAPMFAVLLVVIVLVVVLTELTSNTATTAALAPILVGMAVVIGLQPAPLGISVAFAASCAFMLPVATPPNAVMYGTGKIPLADMRYAGTWMNAVAVILVAGVALLWIPYVMR
ncbi:MAG: DASS family sodium-coupled anion symporter [Pseudomonadota bacterium]